MHAKTAEEADGQIAVEIRCCPHRVPSAVAHQLRLPLPELTNPQPI